MRVKFTSFFPQFFYPLCFPVLLFLCGVAATRKQKALDNSYGIACAVVGYYGALLCGSFWMLMLLLLLLWLRKYVDNHKVELLR